ncbi:MAG: hypothetical protein ACP5P7_03280, partial [Sulfurihydrogenibium sp.]
TKHRKTKMENQNKKTLNYPFIILTGFGIVATLIFVFLFVYQLSVGKVRQEALIEFAYPKITPQEYYNELKNVCQKNNFEFREIYIENNYFLVQIYSKDYLQKAKDLSPSVVPLVLVNLSISALPEGTAVVGNNPYLWRVMIENKQVDAFAKDYTELVKLILNDVYYSVKQKKKNI